ncbi:beta-galactosidase, partial [Candidatus Bathyarchaeota archaeon]|nr:beta-galactosidase [Candidatus Bathyarchaeota archaeon]
MKGAIHRVAVLILIAVLIASTLLILYTKNIISPPTGEIEEKPAEKPSKAEEKTIVEEKPKEIRGDRFGFVCFDEEALEDLNLGWVRPHPGPFIWGHIEPKEGRYDFSEADEVVRRAQEMGLNILATIWPYADWDQERWGDIERFVMEDFPELPRSRYKPYDMETYKKFVKALVERYDGDGVDDMPGLERPIKYWEVLNEPSTGVKAKLHGKRKAFFMGDAEDYFEILKATYEAVKEADPEAKVLNGGMILL